MSLTVQGDAITLGNAPRGEAGVHGVWKEDHYELGKGLFAGGTLALIDGGKRVEYKVNGSGVQLVDGFRGDLSKA